MIQYLMNNDSQVPFSTAVVPAFFIGLALSFFEGERIYVIGYVVLLTIALIGLFMYKIFSSVQEARTVHDITTYLQSKLGIDEHGKRPTIKTKFVLKDAEW